MITSGYRAAVAVALTAWVGFVSQPVAGAQAKPPAAAPVEKLSDTTFRLGSIFVDTSKRQISVPGVVNQVALGGPLEFLASTKSHEPGLEGFRSYESALELDTNAITFNAALLLIGLQAPERDPSMSMPEELGGDPVEIWVEWDADGEHRRVRAEELLFNHDTGKTMPASPWIYTGSLFVQDYYAAESEGVLVGFIHRSAPVIERKMTDGIGMWGHIEFNRTTGLRPGAVVTLTVVAVER